MTIAGDIVDNSTTSQQITHPLVFTNATTNLSAAGGTLTLQDISAGANGITKSGAGVVFIQGTGTYSGPTTVTQGVLRANDGGALPTASALLLNGGALELNASTFARNLGTGAGQ